MDFAAESYDDKLYKLTTTITNTGDTDIEMHKGVFRFHSDVSYFALFNYTTGNLSYPDTDGLAVSIIADDELYIHSITHSFPTESWSNSKLKKDESFAVIAHVKVHSTTLSALADSMKFFDETSVPPLFHSIKINLTGNDGNQAKVYFKKEGGNAISSALIVSNKLVDMRIGKTYNVWSEDFIKGTYRYISTGTETSPFSVLSEKDAELILDFTKEEVETTSFTINVSGLPQGVSVPAELNSIAETLTYNLTLSNGVNQIQQVFASTYTLKINAFTDASALTYYTPNYTPNTSISLSGPNNSTVSFVSTPIYPFTVKGFPSHLSHGAVTSASPSIDENFIGTEIDVIFKYSGNDGAGDRGSIASVSITENTIEQSRRLEQEMNRKVMPLMIHYTANASGGGSKEAIKDLEGDNLYYHYRSLIAEIETMLQYKDDTHPYPASFIISPDLLGAVQLDVKNGHDEGILTKVFEVNAKLQLAFENANIDTSSLPSFEDNFKGYLQSINYLITYVGECSIPFGYQQNVWSTGSALWVYDLANEANDAQTVGSEVATFINNLGVYTGDWKPDFIAFDRYERDCFGPDGRSFYAWMPKHWDKYLDYCKVVAEGIGNPPIMLWQIPGGHIPTHSETLVNFDPNRFSSAAPQYLLGDSALDSGASNAADIVKNIPLSGTHYGTSSTVGELLANDPHDWSTNQLKRLADMHVFNICWGGGATLSTVPIGTNGNDDGWLANKIKSYNNDVYFNSNKDFGYEVSPGCSQTLALKNNAVKLFAYPNPAKDKLLFNKDLNISAFHLYDAKGRLILHVNQQIRESVSLKGLDDGLYFAKVNLDNGKEVTFKVVKGN
jgi:hypothetical protein